MIDLHSHILPNIDHGANSEEITLKMLNIAASQGTTKIVATPHYYCDIFTAYYDDVIKVTEKIRDLIKDNGVEIEIYHGQEVHFHREMWKSYEQGKIGTINSTRYMLVELPTEPISKDLFRDINELKVRGIIPIIAHPERYLPFIEEPNNINEFINEGYLFQLNGQSILGSFGEKTRVVSEIFLKNGIYNFLGSDGHDDNKRNTGLEEVLDTIKSMNNMGIQILKMFKEDGEKVLNNEIINFKGEKIK